MKFGDFDFVTEPIANFEGGKTASAMSYIEYSLNMVKNTIKQEVDGVQTAKSKNLVDSRDVMMHYLYTRAQANGGQEAHQ